MTTSRVLVELEIVVEQDGNEFYAYCPALTGLHTSGQTVEEACANARDAATAHLQSLIQHGDPLPIGRPKTQKRTGAVHTCRQESTLLVAVA